MKYLPGAPSTVCSIQVSRRVFGRRVDGVSKYLAVGSVLLLAIWTRTNAQVQWCKGEWDVLKSASRDGLKVVLRRELPFSTASESRDGSAPEGECSPGLSKALGIDFAYVSNVVHEVSASSVRATIASASGSHLARVTEYNVFAATNAQLVVMAALKEPSGLQEEATALVDYIDWYISCRMEGHSAAYALESLKVAVDQQPREVAETYVETLRRRFRIPYRWLQTSSNDLSYFVVDGPVAWFYDGGGYRRRDARELSPDFKSKLESVSAEVRKGGRLVPRAYYGRIKQLLKERYGVDWLSPLDLNPGVQVDWR